MQSLAVPASILDLRPPSSTFIVHAQCHGGPVANSLNQLASALGHQCLGLAWADTLGKGTAPTVAQTATHRVQRRFSHCRLLISCHCRCTAFYWHPILQLDSHEWEVWNHTEDIYQTSLAARCYNLKKIESI